MNKEQPILLVEDDEVDALAIQRACHKLGIENKIYHHPGAEEAWKFLQECNLKKPALAILDIRLPGMSGLELLRQMKQDPVLKKIPVVMLTTSSEQDDRRMSFEQGAAGYMIKPMGNEKFQDVMATIYEYWKRSELAD